MPAPTNGMPLTNKVLFSVIIPVMLFMGGNMIANDRRSVDEDKSIRKDFHANGDNMLAIAEEHSQKRKEEMQEEMKEIKKEIKEDIKEVKDSVLRVKNQQNQMQTQQNQMAVDIGKILATLEKE